ncbi:MAG: hypothetical protein AAF961_19200, partial [Planctomycetota bacterium]
MSGTPAGNWPRVSRIALLICLSVPIGHASAVNLVIDYSYDSPALGGSDFFGAGNPAGAIGATRARAALETAADFFSTILTDSFSAIETPESFSSAVFDGTATFSWTMDFYSPGSGELISLVDQTIAQDEYRIYVGGQNLGAATLALGGRGGESRSSITPGLFTGSEAALVEATRDEFFYAVDDRGEEGFGAWGGAVSFSNSANVNWHFDHEQLPASNEIDFFSVAIHELIHTLGFAGSQEWLDLIEGDPPTFIGEEAMNLYGGPVPLNVDMDHWADGLETTVYGTADLQLSVMDRFTLEGERNLFGTIDAAALADLGWQVSLPSLLDADFNGDTVVNGLDLAIWEQADRLGADADA